MRPIFSAMLACAFVAAAYAQEQPVGAEADEAKVDEALEAEIAYVEALINAGYPDYAEPVIAATKAKWP